ncbi:hypothetical protein T07_6369 [Trichinella nelsoni]|uniref:Uncharacterized protein n=1 Tax=Trichinella nelsoni TaxID=6336 RepID=A0A0V0RP76_9BILA|nr:hypothetical protein T07_6369 [Trichinella nelsoni]
MVSSNIRMEDVLKGRLTSVIIFIQNEADSCDELYLISKHTARQ